MADSHHVYARALDDAMETRRAMHGDTAPNGSVRERLAHTRLSHQYVRSSSLYGTMR